MSGVREWISVICISAVACTMLEFIAPDGKMEKMVRLVFGTFMVIAIISPLIDTVSNIDIRIHNRDDIYSVTSEFSENISEQSINVARQNTKRIIESELNEMNLKSKKIDVFMDKRDKDCISITKVKVFMENESLTKKEEVRNKLKNKLDLDIEVL